MDSDSLERDLRAVYGAYEYLREHDLAGRSTTSRLLRAGDLVFLARRLNDETDELRGAVAGTHTHGGGRDDVVLEAYQCLYWLCALAVAAGDRYDDVRPHEALDGPDGLMQNQGASFEAASTGTARAYSNTPLHGPAMGGRPAAGGSLSLPGRDGPRQSDPAEQTRGAALRADYTVPSADLADPEQRRRVLREGFATMGDACRRAGVPVYDAVRRDLQELQTKEYLAPYWRERGEQHE